MTPLSSEQLYFATPEEGGADKELRLDLETGEDHDSDKCPRAILSPGKEIETESVTQQSICIKLVWLTRPYRLNLCRALRKGRPSRL